MNLYERLQDQGRRLTEQILEAEKDGDNDRVDRLLKQKRDLNSMLRQLQTDSTENTAA